MLEFYLLWSLISAVRCATSSATVTNAWLHMQTTAKHISNSNGIKAHACCSYCTHLSQIPHTQFVQCVDMRVCIRAPNPLSIRAFEHLSILVSLAREYFCNLFHSVSNILQSIQLLPCICAQIKQSITRHSIPKRARSRTLAHINIHTYIETRKHFHSLNTFCFICWSYAFNITALNIQLRLFGGFIFTAVSYSQSFIHIWTKTYVDANILTKQRTELKNFKFAK